MPSTPLSVFRVSMRWKRRIAASLACSCLPLMTGCVGPPLYEVSQPSALARARMVHREPIHSHNLRHLQKHSGNLAVSRPQTERQHSSHSRSAVRQVSHEVVAPSPPVSEVIHSPQTAQLAPEQVRCQAALAAAPVQLIEIERQFAYEKTSNTRCISEEVANQVQQLLMLRSAIRGNEASVSALKIYYQLAEGQAQLRFLNESVHEIEMMQSDVDRILDRGFDIDIRPGDLERQKLDIEQRRGDIEGQLIQGWARLQTLLGEEPTSPLPEFSLLAEQPTLAPELENAIQTAMHLRPELRLLRVLITGMRPETLSAAVAALQQVESSLGTASELDVLKQLSEAIFIIKPFTKFCKTRDIEVRTTQLVILLNDQEQSARGEVHAALAAWNTAFRRWNSADQLVASWNSQVDELRRKKEVDETISNFDIRQAELQRIQAESDRLSAFFAQKQAEVALLEAQGTAAIGCGLAGHEPFWCDSCKTTHGESFPSNSPGQPHGPRVIEPTAPLNMTPAPAPAPLPPEVPGSPLTRRPSVRSPRQIRHVANTSGTGQQTLEEIQATRLPLGRCRPVSSRK